VNDPMMRRAHRWPAQGGSLLGAGGKFDVFLPRTSTWPKVALRCFKHRRFAETPEVGSVFLRRDSQAGRRDSSTPQRRQRV